MSLYKRARSKYWWCKVTWRGEEIRKSTKATSKTKAREFEKRLLEQLWEIKQLGKTAYTWDMAAERWLEERAEKRSLSTDESILAWMQPHLTGKRLTEITSKVIDDLRKAKLAEGAGRKTVNRHMSLLRSILRAARDEWEMVSKIPPVPMYPKGEPDEPRWITREQFELLASKIPIPVLERAARFAVLTGLRRTAVAMLTWENVDFEKAHAWVSVLRSKNKKAIPVPLSDEAIGVLESVQGQHEQFAFSYEGGHLPLQNGYFWKQWRAAVAAAELQPIRFHDLRHTWASWHIQAGTPPHILQELGGWSSYEMVRLYAHFTAQHTKQWAGNLG